MKVLLTTEDTENTEGTWMRFFPCHPVPSVVHTAIPSSHIGAR
jgi:hypothetical protein